MANIIKTHETQTLKFTFLKREVLLKKVANNNTVETQDAGHQTSRVKAYCQNKSLSKLE